MFSLVMAKLYSTIMGQKINSLAEHNHKCVLGEARFIPKHSIANHLVK